MGARRLRLDAELVRRGLARSREHAGELVGAGRVRVGGTPALKPATQVDLAAAIVVEDAGEEDGYVSRGAHKLVGALDAFAVDVTGRRCLDAGASTGGFTDVLLRRGADHVVAVDVGYGQIAWSLRTDERVSVLERTNVRTLDPEVVAPAPSLVVADLSFISLTLVLPALVRCAAQDAEHVLMVKPQFEVGREALGAGGVVRSAGLRADAVRHVAAAAADAGLGVRGVAASPLPGPSGNVEYFLHLAAGAPPLEEDALARAIADGPQAGLA
ncbi:TlyA family RNA methyltransferase [Kineococcus sp. LSe6-4]|uniref:TlyA family RNA methyltransferase n=1 Tax=Kineococcus halophytocola TaxID=3234027 RepID=A0ABV4H0L0_9ACTN